MPISPSRREEIQGLIARLGSVDPDDARGAAARLLVIGPRAFEVLRELSVRGSEPSRSRATALLPFLREPRVVPFLAEQLTGDGAPAVAESLAAEGSPAAARALAEAFESSREPVLLAALEVMAERGSQAAVESMARLLKDPAARPTADWAPLVDGLRRSVEARVEDPIGPPPARAPEPPAPDAPVPSSLEAYLALPPDGPDELAARRRLAADPSVVTELATRLEAEVDGTRLSLLSLLASELTDARLLLPLRDAVQRAQDAWRRAAQGPERDALVAAEARAHVALARQGSRAAASDLDQTLRALPPGDVRVEHLGALELVGTRADLPALVGLCAVPGWLGDASLRVLATILGREGLSERVAALRPLDRARRRTVRELLAAASPR